MDAASLLLYDGNSINSALHGIAASPLAPVGSGTVSTVMLHQLLRMLPALDTGGSSVDSFMWQMSDDENFSVASCYKELVLRYVSFGPTNRFDHAFCDV